MESIPYKEYKDGEFFIRSFECNIPDEELKWHFDDENRIIIPTKGTGWKIQLDENLPEDLIIGNEYFIPVDVYHRIIKGSEDLEIKLWKLDNAKNDYPKHVRKYTNNSNISDHLNYHLNNNIKLNDNIFRYGSDAWCDLIQEAKQLFESGILELDENELNLIETDSGKIIFKDGEKYILNTPFINYEKDFDFQYFVYICNENQEIKKIYFNEQNP